ncbi:MAG: A/G-specific adenine glycosylase [Candidatus Taylorbacteria bacterium]|nr:A/G-specific adenine glycosylase [Candidatus Taylorbacteria bacterium]
MTESRFKALIWDYYKNAGRHGLPWRKTKDPYRILVSEVMLQQTQVPRVLAKYPEFLSRFPTTRSLARAKVSEILKVWKGLGYNRRALALKRVSEIVSIEFKGRFPKEAHELESLPGIGPSTRGAIMAFSFGLPTTYIETNIRAVFLHFFFKGKKGVDDKEILPLVERTLDRERPRDWYYALMDYGVYLKRTLPNPSRASKHHARQASFKGSNREVRSKILSYVLEKPRTQKEIERYIGKTPHDIDKNIRDLVKEGFLAKAGKTLSARS